MRTRRRPWRTRRAPLVPRAQGQGHLGGRVVQRVRRRVPFGRTREKEHKGHINDATSLLPLRGAAAGAHGEGCGHSARNSWEARVVTHHHHHLQLVHESSRVAGGDTVPPSRRGCSPTRRWEPRTAGGCPLPAPTSWPLVQRGAPSDHLPPLGSSAPLLGAGWRVGV